MQEELHGKAKNRLETKAWADTTALFEKFNGLVC